MTLTEASIAKSLLLIICAVSCQSTLIPTLYLSTCKFTASASRTDTHTTVKPLHARACVPRVFTRCTIKAASFSNLYTWLRLPVRQSALLQGFSHYWGWSPHVCTNAEGVRTTAEGLRTVSTLLLRVSARSPHYCWGSPHYMYSYTCWCTCFFVHVAHTVISLDWVFSFFSLFLSSAILQHSIVLRKQIWNTPCAGDGPQYYCHFLSLYFCRYTYFLILI